MDVIIIADYLGPLNGKYNSRFLYIGDMFCNEHDVEIITGNFNHGEKKHFDTSIEKHNYKITMINEIGYKRNVCIKRFWSDFIWGKNVKKYLERRKKPDIIYAAIPPLTGAYEAAKYCEKNDIKFIIDVQDLWPEAYRMVFNIPIISSIIFYPFNFLANKIYRIADEIVAVSKTYADRAMSVNNKCKKESIVFLGTDLKSFDKNALNIPLLKKTDDEIWMGYCGSLSDSYDINCVIDAIEILNKQGKKVPKFIVMGNGSKKEQFENYAKEKSADCIFTGLLPYEQMCTTLKQCDMTVNPIVRGSAGSIINKHADYAASGLPVLNTQESAEYRNLVEEYNMGFNCENGNPEDLAKHISILMNDDELRKEMGKNARRCAEERFDRRKTYNNILDIL